MGFRPYGFCLLNNFFHSYNARYEQKEESTMITGILTVVGICLGVTILIALAGVGFASGVMHLLRWIADKVRWILRIEK